jgi:hypothetical protein
LQTPSSEVKTSSEAKPSSEVKTSSEAKPSSEVNTLRSEVFKTNHQLKALSSSAHPDQFNEHRMDFIDKLERLSSEHVALGL